MTILRRIRALWRNLANRQTVEADLDAEIRSYREMLSDEKVAAGIDAKTASRVSAIELGGIDQIKEEVREVRVGSTLLAIAAQLRQSARGLRRNPGMAILGILMLGLGMGASTAVFSVFQSALLKPLPFRDPKGLVSLAESRLDRGLASTMFSEANFWDVRAQSRSFQEIGAFHTDEANLTGMGAAEKTELAAVTGGFFRALGVSPVIGRDFSYDEEHGAGHTDWWNGANVALLGNRFWKSRFGGDNAVLGKTLRLAGRTFTIIGVLPPGEPWLDQPIYIPFGYRADAERGSWEFAVVGRLARGVTPTSAEADLQRIAAVLGKQYPQADRGIGFKLTPSSEWIADESTRRALWVLLGAVTFLMLIGSLNVANLLLARGTARRREIAVRTALGAGRGRLACFVMMESLLLSACGAALALAVAYAAVQAMKGLEISTIPRLADASLNGWVLAFAAAIALATGLLAGIAPALQTPVNGIVTALREGDRQTGGGAGARLRAGLVAAEVALSFLLLAGAGLLIHSFTKLMSVDRGFQTQNRLLFSLSIPGNYWADGAGKRLIDQVLQRLSSLPEVQAVGSVSLRPMDSSNPGMSIDSNQRTRGSGNSAPPWAGWRIITPGYFRVIGLPLLRGRIFDENDKPVWAQRGQPEPQRRVIISQRLAKVLFPNQDPIGKHVLLWKGQSNRDAEIVGVVGDSRERGLASNSALTVYLPWGANALTSEIAVQTRGNQAAVASVIRSLVAQLDSNVPVSDIRSFEEVAANSVAPQRLNAILLGTFSGLALLLASAGIYGVLAYSTTRKTPEIGLRVALGASRGEILRMTVLQGLRPALVGIAFGAAGACWLTRYLKALLFNVQPFDLPTYLAVTGLLLVTAALACYVPGRRAMRIDPAVALRVE